MPAELHNVAQAQERRSCSSPGPPARASRPRSRRSSTRSTSEQAYHIITIEDPVEYMHRHVKSTVNQREVGADTKTFALALRAALRQAPKVILIGEMRDLETIETAMEAAETGHLVLSTLHTIDAAKTIDRIVGVFPEGPGAAGPHPLRAVVPLRHLAAARAQGRRRAHRRARDSQVDDADPRLHPQGGDRRPVAHRRHARRRRSTACRRSTTSWRSSCGAEGHHARTRPGLRHEPDEPRAAPGGWRPGRLSQV